MGLLLSVLLSYAGALETLECIRHILAGVLPEGDPDFETILQYYNIKLQKTSNPQPISSDIWSSSCGQGYLCLKDNEEGQLTSASIQYYGDHRNDSTALLFSTKISSFGQDSVDSNSNHNGYGSKGTPERYSTTTKTIIPQTHQSFSVGARNKSPTELSENIPDSAHSLGNSFEHRGASEEETVESTEKLTWHYRPRSPLPQASLPEIHFQSYDQNTLDFKHDPETPYSEEFLRSLDGVKFRPLQRNDPTGRRRSYKKRHSSSSTSSRESRASREEELKIFTSLEEAEFENNSKNAPVYGSSPNLTTRSHSRSRSRENTNEPKTKVGDSWAHGTSAESAAAEDEDVVSASEAKPLLRDLPKLDSFEEEKPEDTTEKEAEVTENVEDDDFDDFWGKNDD